MQRCETASRRATRCRFLLPLALLVCTLAATPDFVPPAPTHFVTDEAGALRDSTRASVDARLRAYATQSGHQIIVWIGETTGGVPLETWTVETAHAWRVGRRGYDDGAVLFLFMRDHRVRIEVGYGLESKLTDADAKRIIDATIVPAMRAGNPDLAVASGVDQMIAVVGGATPAAGDENAPSSAGGTGRTLAGLFAFLLLAAGFTGMLLFFIWRISKSAGHGGGTWITSSGSSGGWSSSSSSDDDDDFSSGGGDFGGGGASGSW